MKDPTDDLTQISISLINAKNCLDSLLAMWQIQRKTFPVQLEQALYHMRMAMNEMADERVLDWLDTFDE